MPSDRPIYFSVDFDATPAQQAMINEYFAGVASVIGIRRTGAYGGYYVIMRRFDAGKIFWGWQTYAWSGGQWDPRAQLRQVQNDISVGGAACDQDEAVGADFGQWGPKSSPGPAHNPFTPLAVDGAFAPQTTKALQWKLGVATDGIFGPQTKMALQRYLKVPVDGDVGPVTIRALQKHVGATQDGIWGPLTTEALQRALNAGAF